MKVVAAPPTYQPPRLFFSTHLETIYPSLFRKVDNIKYHRERIFTPDQDFIDLDWLIQKSNQLVIVSHGLEGSTSRAYMKGMAHAFYETGYDVLTWNYRGCSEEMNWQMRFYHSGATDDLDLVIQHALKSKNYASIALIGFSLGGNLTLKYLGEQSEEINPIVKRCIVFSAPLDLLVSCQTISRQWIYSQRFLRSLKQKVFIKAVLKPELETQHLDKIKTLIDFDDVYTAPLHHFNNALDYYQKCSAIHFIEKICIPTRIINALNDPFLDPLTYQHPALKKNPLVQLETPSFGGHVGFTLFNQNGLYWSELKALDFIVNEYV